MREDKICQGHVVHLASPAYSGSKPGSDIQSRVDLHDLDIDAEHPRRLARRQCVSGSYQEP